ncbi:MAG: response regulator [Elusimicrobia bacterium]|nr:response regulator [Elusimicrobiota bacterium]
MTNNRQGLFSKIAGLTAAAAGLAVLVGWIFDIAVIKSLSPNLVAMKANTALCFALAGFSLLLLDRQPPANPARRLAVICAAIVLLTGFLTLCEYLSGWNIGLDQLLFREAAGAVGTSHPGRMAPATAFNFLLIGLSLLVLDVPSQPRLAQFLAAVAGATGLLNFFGYVYGVKSLYTVGTFTIMAVHTAVIFVILSLGLLNARLDRGFMTVFASDTTGGTALRRMIPFAFIVPFVLGWLNLMGQKAGIWDAGYGLALFSILMTAILVVLISLRALELHRNDLKRRAAEQELRESRDKLTFDVTEQSRKLTDTAMALDRETAERKRYEAQFLQAQKMEAVGRLAGGVAHDFNNLLTAILANCSFLIESLETGDPRRNDAEEIKNAADRAAGLTRQLLAFSRQQVFQMKILDINIVITGMEKLLRRLLGENIELVIRTAGLGKIKADINQIEQVIMNLAINAKDAMPIGGRVIIETSNTELDEAYVNEHMDSKPGPHVMLSITDAGTGMKKEILEHIFEPFFTTKERGKGTGLGLATVYGIVKQSRGNIWAYSEPGRGATFKIYFPLTDETAPNGADDKPAPVLSKGSETILLVEDDEKIRKISRRALERYGYTVLEAADGETALSISRAHQGTIHLSVTDIIMPEMGGREFVEQLTKSRPEIKILFVSGYAGETAAQAGVNFLQKPFTPEILAQSVRRILDSK